MGFGDNKKMPYPFSLNDYVNYVKDRLDKMGVKKPCVIAHSFGARIAVKLAGSDPDFFDKIVLVGAAGLKPRFSIKRCAKRLTFKILKLFVKRERLKRFYSKDYLSLSPVMRESFKKIISEDLSSSAKKVANKTLIVVGDRDKETPVYMAKRYYKLIKNSTLLVFKGAGHFAFIDMPDKFNREAKEFLL